jgi:hypothetical protein
MRYHEYAITEVLETKIIIRKSFMYHKDGIQDYF